ncbi:DUF4361 domain-containing protein [Olivibacter ginsenosidimutans]|uniref:DUF4361 domain-containing protein n=2 Tax=Olivibacter ginsenosidimutans TaxID=1176537 RepID=A0ABP9AKV1_9SPHI
MAWITSCKDNELFEKEMYKNVVALISSEYYNTFQEEVPLTGEEFVGYIAASAGGTHATDKDLVIEFAEDSLQFNYYNFSVFDADSNLYARLLPKQHYEIPDYKITIPAGERTGKTLIKIKPEGLSPDSTYFVSLKIKENSNVEVNEEKNTVLYQVLIKNAYASQASDELYTMSGYLNEAVTAGNKKMFPLSRNKVRIIAGNETFESNVDHINKTAIVLEVTDDNKVLITPYKDIEVSQVDGDPNYPNTFKTEESFGRKYNSFLLAYDYVLNGETHHMQEELRMEVKKE